MIVDYHSEAGPRGFLHSEDRCKDPWNQESLEIPLLLLLSEGCSPFHPGGKHQCDKIIIPDGRQLWFEIAQGLRTAFVLYIIVVLHSHTCKGDGGSSQLL